MKLLLILYRVVFRVSEKIMENKVVECKTSREQNAKAKNMPMRRKWNREYGKKICTIYCYWCIIPTSVLFLDKIIATIVCEIQCEISIAHIKPSKWWQDLVRSGSQANLTRFMIKNRCSTNILRKFHTFVSIYTLYSVSPSPLHTNCSTPKEKSKCNTTWHEHIQTYKKSFWRCFEKKTTWNTTENTSPVKIKTSSTNKSC